MYDVECEMALEQMLGNRVSSGVDLGYTKLLCNPGVTSVSFYTCDSVLGSLWTSINNIKVPYMFDWEHGIALHTMQGNRTSTRAEG